MDFNFVLPSHGNPIVLDWIKEGKAVFQQGPLDTPCLIWRQSMKDGYGQLSYNGKRCFAHRVAINAFRELHSLHSCDVKACCNPWHLREGTTQENYQDYKERVLDVDNQVFRNINGRNCFIRTNESRSSYTAEKVTIHRFESLDALNQWIAKEIN